MQGAWVWSLVGELRSHMLSGKKKSSHYTNILNVFNVLLSSKLNLKKKRKNVPWYPISDQKYLENSRNFPKAELEFALCTSSYLHSIYI